MSRVRHKLIVTSSKNTSNDKTFLSLKTKVSYSHLYWSWFAVSRRDKIGA